MDKRLAVEVEDHPLEYADFEGLIPEGNYGAGTVLVWDVGVWHPHGDAAEMLRKGNLKFELEGERLRGLWSLIRTKSNNDGPRSKQLQWLLTKKADSEARADVDVVAIYPGSVHSLVRGDSASALPKFVEPKLPTLSDAPPRGDDWIYELKLDGYRMQAQWRADGFRLMTRSGHDWTGQYRAIASELSVLDLNGTIIDGELVALDATGKSDFNLLANARKQSNATLAYFAFDLLFLRGNDLRREPLIERKSQLKAMIASAPTGASPSRLQYLDHITNDVDALISRCQSLGLEGIVAKRIDRGYTSGRASDWVKTKFRYRESLIVVGFETTGPRRVLASLLLGYYDKNHSLRFAGRVGTGWSEPTAVDAVKRLEMLAAEDSPLAKPLTKSNRSRSNAEEVTWVRPLVIVDVDFATWTDNRQLRHASFIGWNEDTQPRDVTSSYLFADRSGDEFPATKVTAATAPVVELPGLSHEDRVLFPDEQITKRDVATYLYQVAQWMLPHVMNRPMSFLRCPEGINGATYFQRHPNQGSPSPIATLSMDHEDEPLLMLPDMAALLATAQISAIELHPWGCQGGAVEKPDRLVMDLDPDESMAWNKVSEAAYIIRAALKRDGLQSFVKTTGGKGLHVMVPLSGKTSWDHLFSYSKKLAESLATSHKTLFVANMSKSRRRDRIFVDYHRNRRGATAIAAYSLRARPGAPVSTPVTWDELPQVNPADFNLRTVPPRLARLSSDPWASLQSLRQTLKSL